MQFKPYDYQQLAIDDAVRFLSTATPGTRKLYAAPTGSGKSVIELCVQAALIGAWIVTPVVEIIAGLLTKLCIDVADLSEAKLLDTAFTHNITTPIRFRNMLIRGDVADPPRYLILDEAHHDNADTWRQLDLLSGLPPAIGFTASPFRGTPRGTAIFKERWGEPQWILTYPEAAARGVISIPRCTVQPILDDDVIDVQNGEFVVSQIDAGTPLDAVVSLAKPFYGYTGWDRPTMFACPSTMLAECVAKELNDAGLCVHCITGKASRAERDRAFAECIERRAALVQVRVVGEGVDLPIRRLIDLAPAVSPVRWLQLFGRITRPVTKGEPAPEYICCNRNLLRHAYLLDGCISAAAIVDAQKVFNVGTRNHWRAFGLESLGKFKQVDVPLRGGMQGFLYCLAAVENLQVTNYAAFVHPTLPEPLWAKRVDAKKADGTRAFGRWQRCDTPADLTGFASVPAPACTEKQLAWWKRDAGRFGLDPEAEVNRRTFQALPILADLGARIAS